MKVSGVELASRVKERARALGFDLVGIAPAIEPPHWSAFQEWLADGCHAEMAYMERWAALRAHPAKLLPGARSVVVLGMYYGGTPPKATAEGQGSVARFALGRDYHLVIREKLRTLAGELRQIAPGVATRGTVDSAPIMERDFAHLAGLGWFGKNTTLICEPYGSWVFLATLITTVEMPADSPGPNSRCGSCRACLDACPTGALTRPYRLDARRCLSYWTVEAPGPLPAEIAQRLAGRVFGCDTCQQVCPFNQASPPPIHPEFSPREGVDSIDLRWLRAIDHEEFRRFAGDSPLFRAGLGRLQRNALAAGEETLQ